MSNESEPSALVIKCKHWRWMPGMVGLHEFGARWRITNVSTDGRVFGCAQANSDFEQQLSDTLPDLSDPATLGCLRELVREAWGDENAFTDPRGGWRVCISSAGPLHGHDMEFVGDTEAEALVAALESAPASLRTAP